VAHILVTPDMRLDLLWWACNAQSHNGKAILLNTMLLWNGDLVGRHAALHCDNTVAQHTLNKGSAYALPMHALIRRMYTYMAAENIRVRVLRISSEANVLADCLSRIDPQGYAAARREIPTPLPGDVWSARLFSNHRCWNRLRSAIAPRQLPAETTCARSRGLSPSPQPVLMHHTKGP
jgi:hypothetical protein